MGKRWARKLHTRARNGGVLYDWIAHPDWKLELDCNMAGSPLDGASPYLMEPPAACHILLLMI